MRDFNGAMGLWGMGMYRDLIGVMGAFELIEGFDVAGGGGASEAKGKLEFKAWSGWGRGGEHSFLPVSL